MVLCFCLIRLVIKAAQQVASYTSVYKFGLKRRCKEKLCSLYMCLVIKEPPNVWDWVMVGKERERETEREVHLLDMVDRWLQLSAMKHHEGQGSKMSLPGIARFHRQAEWSPPINALGEDNRRCKTSRNKEKCSIPLPLSLTQQLCGQRQSRPYQLTPWSLPLML